MLACLLQQQRAAATGAATASRMGGLDTISAPLAPVVQWGGVTSSVLDRDASWCTCFCFSLPMHAVLCWHPFVAASAAAMANVAVVKCCL